MNPAQDPIYDEQDVASRRRRRGLIALLLAFSLATVGAGLFSLAVFTDSDTVAGTWTAGTVAIDATTPGTEIWEVDSVMPGDSGSQTVNVENTGTAELRYSMTTSESGTLAGQLQLTVKEGACPSTGAVVVATGALGSAAFGNPAQGDDDGDRTLLAGEDEDLCFEWSLPLDTGNSYQGASTTATFTFDAEQTANNP
jgi:hypothetical protein